MADLDIGLPDISKAIEQAEKFLVITKKNTEAYVELAKTIKAATASNPLSSAKDYNQIAIGMRASQDALKGYNKEKANEQRLSKQLKEATDAEVKGKIRLQQATAAQKKLLTEEIALENKQIGTLQKLAIESNKLRRERDKLNLETKEGTTRLKEINNQLDINNAKLKQFSDKMKQDKLSVGGYTDAINKAKFGLMNFASALGVATGIYAFTNALRGAFDIIRNNEDAFASLSAITGLTGENFEVFKTAINETALEIKVSSTEVAEAAEKIASAQPKLLENADALAAVTKEAITLNKAIKGDLTETSLALVGVMNQFGVEASEASRIINILAAGSQAGAADVNQVNESMVKFGTTAKILNVSIEESVGLIETLGEKAIFGAEAGTALKNVMLIMSSIDVLPPKALAQLEKYGVDTSIVTDTTISFSDRLKELSKIGQDTTAIMQIFGKENATAATVLLNSTDTLDHMTAAVTGTNVAQEQAAINSNTLSNRAKELSAAWENLVIKWADGTDVAGGLKDILAFVAENLEEIIGWVFTGVKAWIVYKSTLTLVNKEGTGMIQMFQNLKKGVDGAKFSVGTLVKGFAGILGIAVTLVPMLWDMVKATYDMYANTSILSKVTEKYTEEVDKERAKMDLLRVQVQGAIGDKDKMAGLVKEMNATFGTTLKNLDDETEMMNQLWEAYRKVNAEMERRIMQQILEDELTEAFKAKRKFESAQNDLGDKTTWNSAEWNLYQDGIDRSTTAIKELQFELNRLQNGQSRSQGLGGIGIVGGIPKVEKPKDDPDPKKGKTADQLKKEEFDKLKKQNELYLIYLENSLIESGLERNEIEKILAKQRIDSLKIESDNALRIFGEFSNEYLEANLAYNKTLLTDEKDSSIAYFDIKNRMYQDFLDTQKHNLEIEENNLLKSGATKEQIEKALEERRIKNLQDARDKALEIYGKMSEEFWQAELELNRALVKSQEDSIKDLQESIAKMQESAAALIQTIQDINNAKIESIDAEIEQRKTQKQSHEDRISEMKQLASEGVLTAEESIKAEEAKVSVLENSIAELEAKKQKLLAVNLGLQTALNIAESGDPAAISKALGQVGGFVSSLKSFKDGTDDTGSGGNLDKDGGFLAKLHPDEMVFQKELSDELRSRGLDRYDTTAYAMKYHDDIVNGKTMEYSSFGDIMTLATLNGIKDGQDKMITILTELPKKMPVNKTDYNPVMKAIVEKIKVDNEIKNYITYLRK